MKIDRAAPAVCGEIIIAPKAQTRDRRSHWPAGLLIPLLATLALQTAQAADWSDTYLGYRYGTRFAEPFGPNDIHKNILNLGYAGGNARGTHFLNLDVLLSDHRDPAGPATGKGAQEAYLVYRYTLDLAGATGIGFKAGPVRDLGLTAGFDLNGKNDAGYNSQKRMLVLGPTLMLDVPGFLNVSLLQLWESNAPHNDYTGTDTPRYRYKPHPMLSLAWGIPLGDRRLSFNGYANFIAAKGRDEFGARTRPETNVDLEVMYDFSQAVGLRADTFKAGLEYQYWKNKFGNDSEGPAGSGAFARTPMVRCEYHL